MSLSKSILLVCSSMVLLSACSSGKLKERREQRDRVAQSTKMYCEFINGEQNPDIDIAVNLEMAKRCDSEKPFTVTSYKTPTEIPGILYCCSMRGSSAERMKKSQEVKKEETKPATDEIESANK